MYIYIYLFIYINGRKYTYVYTHVTGRDMHERHACNARPEAEAEPRGYGQAPGRGGGRPVTWQLPFEVPSGLGTGADGVVGCVLGFGTWTPL